MENINVLNNEVVAIMTTKERRRSFKKDAETRLGETKLQNCGEIAFIVEYIHSQDIRVQFKSTGEVVKCTYQQFNTGNVKSHFTPSIYGIGIVGLESITDAEGKNLDSYQVWTGILRRCYSVSMQEKYPTYKGCTVCDSWLIYSNFKKWYNENFYKLDNQRMECDKDILVKGNKMYSPRTCIFVPHKINSLFTKRQNHRGDLPIGVAPSGKKGFIAQCNTLEDGRQYKKCLGSYKTHVEAFNAYKEFKEGYIKQIADEYKEKIPNLLYEAMYEYKVNITD